MLKYGKMRKITALFNLSEGEDNREKTLESIKKNISFKGANLWILACAIIIASVGLNVNSTAVIIGAMLISPLMGPIVGAGFALGIYDFGLLKRSLKNLLIATAVSLTVSTLYFFLSPFKDVQSELLARTAPNIYDILIAFFGGLVGVIAVTRVEKGNPIPGVAIATALMPPLCTAGYGLATGNLVYFLGALYLYFINSVFISLATFLGIRVMHFKQKEFLDKSREKSVRKYIILIVILTMCPAIYLTVGILKSTFYQASANRFINKELAFDNTQVINREINPDKKNIRVVLIGPEIPQASISIARDKLKDYSLEGSTLTVLQGMNNKEIDISSLRATVMEDFYKNSEQRMQDQQDKIYGLERSLDKYKEFATMGRDIVPEMKVLYPTVTSLSIAKSLETRIDSMKTDTVTLAVLQFSKNPSVAEKQQLVKWLKARLGTKNLRLITEQ